MKKKEFKMQTRKVITFWKIVQVIYRKFFTRETDRQTERPLKIQVTFHSVSDKYIVLTCTIYRDDL